MVDPVAALQKKMVELGLGQKEMGLRLRVSQSTMSRIIARLAVPTLPVQVRMEKDFGIRVEWWPDPRAEYLKKRRRSA